MLRARRVIVDNRVKCRAQVANPDSLKRTVSIFVPIRAMDNEMRRMVHANVFVRDDFAAEQRRYLLLNDYKL